MIPITLSLLLGPSAPLIWLFFPNCSYSHSFPLHGQNQSIFHIRDPREPLAHFQCPKGAALNVSAINNQPMELRRQTISGKEKKKKNLHSINPKM